MLDQCYRKFPWRDMLREAVNKEMDAESASLKEQFPTALTAAPASWGQHVQQSQTPESEEARPPGSRADKTL